VDGCPRNPLQGTVFQGPYLKPPSLKFCIRPDEFRLKGRGGGDWTHQQNDSEHHPQGYDEMSSCRDEEMRLVQRDMEKLSETRKDTPGLVHLEPESKVVIWQTALTFLCDSVHPCYVGQRGLSLRTK